MQTVKIGMQQVKQVVQILLAAMQMIKPLCRINSCTKNQQTCKSFGFISKKEKKIYKKNTLKK
jgi:hypothetical protein